LSFLYSNIFIISSSRNNNNNNNDDDDDDEDTYKLIVKRNFLLHIRFRILKYRMYKISTVTYPAISFSKNIRVIKVLIHKILRKLIPFNNLAAIFFEQLTAISFNDQAAIFFNYVMAIHFLTNPCYGPTQLTNSMEQSPV
jgi:hypothetical protein